ncbi:hypothetical protein Lal_00012742 [Lupinus albus]|nr:hypothetical protein Lal_00012742 [Lupinus albus]
MTQKVTLVARNLHMSSAKDRNSIYANMSYFEELDYTMFRVPILSCIWVDNNNGFRVNELGFMVDLNRSGYKDCNTPKFILQASLERELSRLGEKWQFWAVDTGGERRGLFQGQGVLILTQELEKSVDMRDDVPVGFNPGNGLAIDMGSGAPHSLKFESVIGILNSWKPRLSESCLAWARNGNFGLLTQCNRLDTPGNRLHDDKLIRPGGERRGLFQGQGVLILTQELEKSLCGIDLPCVVLYSLHGIDLPYVVLDSLRGVDLPYVVLYSRRGIDLPYVVLDSLRGIDLPYVGEYE